MSFGRSGSFGRGFGHLGAGGGSSILPAAMRANAPDVFLNFATNQALVGGVRSTASSLLTVSRALAKTNLFPTSASGFSYTTFSSGVAAITPGSGLSVEEARTNVLLNSTAPATQTTASLATGTYTLWVNGAGSATPSAGTATITGAAAASNGSPNLFTVTVAGTVTITVAGALNAFQCELGAFGTSLIVTAGTTLLRPADVITLTSPPTFGSSVSLYAQGVPQAPNNYAATQPILSADDGTLTNRNQIFRPAASSTLQLFMTNTGGNVSFGSRTASQGASFKAAVAFAASDHAISVGGQATESDATVTGAAVASQVGIGKRGDGGSFWNGIITQGAIWKSTRLSNATLQAIST